ncbi:hypothetical protein [Puniceibacterium sp. IMCC21224]|uniref:hypothetical protein n=1 Tax=Puniceibacterium sp. IMCC21224 TaxID=1618204 RepID=UPI00064E1006|nr:hypothetical protein [Puniceibacterium sp. IMCC21224]KMK64113.1 hypothetical protein IMCC21224_1591 [Puniceibacterium sp. IMCC21224]
MNTKLLSVLVTGLMMVSQTATAQIETVPVGTVTATIGEAAYDGETLDVPSEGTSTAEWRTFGPVSSLSIQAHDPDAESIMQGILTIEISLMGTDASGAMMDASVSWWPEGMNAPFYMNEEIGEDLNISIYTLSLEEEGSTIKGSFSAHLCRKDSFFAEADTDDCLPVEGHFDTALMRAE